MPDVLKMFVFRLNHVLFFIIFYVSDCQRRIHDGKVVEKDVEKRYVVYMVKAPFSPQLYDAWLCGGALVSKDYIVTSAACVTDVVHLYAIAGYNKYVPHDEINTDPCTRATKKKIIEICTPMVYELNETLSIWSNIDIAVVKVESPYDLSATEVTDGCSYVPAEIVINYEMKYQEPGVDAIVFGWGHNLTWRKHNEKVDYNQELLHYAPTMVLDKNECKEHYKEYEGMPDVIDNYMFCTYEAGNIDAAGETIVTSAPLAKGCSKQLKQDCEPPANETSPDVPERLIVDGRKYDTKRNDKIFEDFEYLNDEVRTLSDTGNQAAGICQNDHGGPLVTWVGNHEVLLGVASVFKITEDFKCIGPYLFTSTQCNGLFIDCIVKSDPSREGNRRALCNSPPSEKGFELINKTISWKDHPDGPAENEKNITSTANTTETTISNQTKTGKEGKNEEYYNFTTNSINTTITNTIINTTTTNITYTTYTTKTTNTNQTKAPNSIRTVTTKVVNVINSTLANLMKFTIQA